MAIAKIIIVIVCNVLLNQVNNNYAKQLVPLVVSVLKNKTQCTWQVLYSCKEVKLVEIR